MLNMKRIKKILTIPEKRKVKITKVSNSLLKETIGLNLNKNSSYDAFMKAFIKNDQTPKYDKIKLSHMWTICGDFCVQ